MATRRRSWRRSRGPTCRADHHRPAQFAGAGPAHGFGDLPGAVSLADVDAGITRGVSRAPAPRLAVDSASFASDTGERRFRGLFTTRHMWGCPGVRAAADVGNRSVAPTGDNRTCSAAPSVGDFTPPPPPPANRGGVSARRPLNGVSRLMSACARYAIASVRDRTVSTTAAVLQESAGWLRAVKANAEATRRRLEASRALVESSRRLLRTLRAGDRRDDAC